MIVIIGHRGAVKNDRERRYLIVESDDVFVSVRKGSLSEVADDVQDFTRCSTKQPWFAVGGVLGWNDSLLERDRLVVLVDYPTNREELHLKTIGIQGRRFDATADGVEHQHRECQRSRHVLDPLRHRPVAVMTLLEDDLMKIG